MNLRGRLRPRTAPIPGGPCMAVPCCNEQGERGKLLVQLTHDRVLLTGPDGRTFTLEVLDAGSLRAALRYVVLSGPDSGRP